MTNQAVTRQLLLNQLAIMRALVAIPLNGIDRTLLRRCDTDTTQLVADLETPPPVQRTRTPPGAFGGRPPPPPYYGHRARNHSPEVTTQSPTTPPPAPRKK